VTVPPELPEALPLMVIVVEVIVVIVRLLMPVVAHSSTAPSRPRPVRLVETLDRVAEPETNVQVKLARSALSRLAKVVRETA